MKGSIEIYELEDGESSVEVTIEEQTIWLNLNQISELFNRDKSVISRHLKNVYSEGELDEESTVAKKAIVQLEGQRSVEREIKFYNLDTIISIGYRVNSKQGTRFRIWATNKLKDILLKGYAVNNQRLEQLKQSVQLIKNTVGNSSLYDHQINEVVDILSDFALGLDILDGYDHQNLEIGQITYQTKYEIKYDEAKIAIGQLKEKFGGSDLFGNEKDDSFKSSIATINQTFGEIDLYPSIEEKAANLLYFIVKNHSFTDGNKRIAAWIFVWYLNKNQFLYSNDGKKKIASNTLAALTLMVALSEPDEKDLIIKVIINSINQKNEAQ